MSNIIRIPLKVHHLNPLSGYATEGLSLAAIQGFFNALTFKTGVEFERFAVLQGEYESKLNEQLKQSRDQELYKNQRSEPSIAGGRYADLELTLYAKTIQPLVDHQAQALCNAINASKFQGGTILNLVTTTDLSRVVSLTDVGIDLDEELVKLIDSHKATNKIHHLFVKPNHDKLDSESTIEYFARKLTSHNKHKAFKFATRTLQDAGLDTTGLPEVSEDAKYLMVCNGYIQHASTVVGSASNALPVVEPSFMLVEAVPVYKAREILDRDYIDEHDSKLWFQLQEGIDNAIIYLIN